MWTRETLTEQLFLDMRQHIYRTDDLGVEYPAARLMAGLRGACTEFLRCHIETTDDLLIMASLIINLVREITLEDQAEQLSSSTSAGVH